MNMDNIDMGYKIEFDEEGGTIALRALWSKLTPQQKFPYLKPYVDNKLGWIVREDHRYSNEDILGMMQEESLFDEMLENIIEGNTLASVVLKITIDLLQLKGSGLK